MVGIFNIYFLWFFFITKPESSNLENTPTGHGGFNTNTLSISYDIPWNRNYTPDYWHKTL